MSADKSGLFLTYWLMLAPQAARDSVVWVAEYKFHPVRRWRFDWAYHAPGLSIGVELDGGQWSAGGGRHNRDTDRDKLNHAAALGWIVYRFSTQQMQTDPAACISLVLQGLGFAPLTD